MGIEVVNLDKWIEQNKQFFLPPVCNKLLHYEQLKVMFIGGPNIRKDYHIEEGEEFFHMLKGDMCLKIVEKGVHKDVHIKEGEVFLLPARVPHSPQRNEGTVGLVIERERFKSENDILRYYVDGSTDVLYEKSFYCSDLVIQLPPVIKAYFNSECYKTAVPSADSLLKQMPFELDESTAVAMPRPLDECFAFEGDGLDIFSGPYQFDIKMFSHGHSETSTGHVEHWLWQINGTSYVKVGDEKMALKSNDSLLVPPNTSYIWDREKAAKTLRIFQDGLRK